MAETQARTQCRNCGAPLGAGRRLCVRCGYFEGQHQSGPLGVGRRFGLTYERDPATVRFSELFFSPGLAIPALTPRFGTIWVVAIFLVIALIPYLYLFAVAPALVKAVDLTEDGQILLWYYELRSQGIITLASILTMPWCWITFRLLGARTSFRDYFAATALSCVPLLPAIIFVILAILLNEFSTVNDQPFTRGAVFCLLFSFICLIIGMLVSTAYFWIGMRALGGFGLVRLIIYSILAYIPTVAIIVYDSNRDHLYIEQEEFQELEDVGPVSTTA